MGQEKQIDEKIAKKTELALLSTYWLSLKEEVITKKENLSYESNLYSDALSVTFQKIYQKIPKIKIGDKTVDEALAFSIIRNKFAHGDFVYLEEDAIQFESYDTKFELKVDDLFQFYFVMQNNLETFKNKSVYIRHILYNKSPKVLTKKLETEKEVEDFLKLLTLRLYYLRSLNKEPIPITTKQTFDSAISKINDVKNKGMNTKRLEVEIRKIYEQQGYSMMIENKKIKDKETIDKIKKAILKNEQLKNSNHSVEALSYVYGEIIAGILLGENKQSLIMGAMINFLILKEEIPRDQFFFLERLTYCYNELLAGLLVARFHTLYSQPLDDFYKKDNNYHLDRSDILDFAQLDIEELKPNIISFEEKGIRELTETIRSLEHKIDKLNHCIHQQMSSKEALETRQKEDEKKKEAYHLLCNKINENQNMKTQLDQVLLEKYHELQKVKIDYQKNKKYFYNLAIIEGIRNSIAHGNVEMLNATETENFNDAEIRFTDIDQGKIVFQLTVTLYEFQCLFESYNINVLEYFKKTKGL